MTSGDGATKPGQDILGLLALERIPEIRWTHGDDLCNCTFQRIGEWTNPYIARTLRVRICCIWAELYKQYPQYVQEIQGYYDENEDRFITEPQVWNSEDSDMPRHLWHRQLAVLLGVPLAEVRRRFGHKPTPQRVPPGTGISDAAIKEGRYK